MFKKTSRKRIHYQKASSSARNFKIQKEIKKETHEKEGLSCCKINFFLRKIPNFYGCFSPDELDNLLISSLPIKLILNLDYSNKAGSHWIALRIEKSRIELFDPLGFRLNKWPSIPLPFLHFLQQISHRRQLFISRELQPSKSSLCGFYCIYYFLAREKLSFRNIVNSFSLSLRKNDKILSALLYKIK